MFFDRTNTAPVRDDDLLSVAVGKAECQTVDLLEHVQHLRDEVTHNSFDKDTVTALVKDIDAADDCRREALDANADAQRILTRMANLAHGELLEMVLELQQKLHLTEDRLDAARVDVPPILQVDDA